MTSPQKRKGNAAELAVARWLREWGWLNAERSRSGWHDDRGDIDGLPGVVVEVKNEKRIDIPGYIGELIVEMNNADAWTGVCIVKRRGSVDVDDWYAIMPAYVWAELMTLVDFPSKTQDTQDIQLEP
jgi:hypothetical protein